MYYWKCLLSCYFDGVTSQQWNDQKTQANVVRKRSQNTQELINFIFSIMVEKKDRIL